MGVISRKVLPMYGSLCFFFPSLQARSRHPVKRYKSILAKIFPRTLVYLLDSNGHSFSKDAKLIGTDPANDLVVLKVDVGGEQLRSAVIGTSGDLRVGQSCFAIGNPFLTGSLALSKHIVEATKHFSVTVSFGSVKSLISLPFFMSHASIPSSVREARGLTEDLVRISVGIEDVEDLIADLNNAIYSGPA